LAPRLGHELFTNVVLDTRAKRTYDHSRKARSAADPEAHAEYPRFVGLSWEWKRYRPPASPWVHVLLSKTQSLTRLVAFVSVPAYRLIVTAPLPTRAQASRHPQSFNTADNVADATA
jgi:hypothetical protein